MIAAGFSDDLVIGLVLGCLFGLLAEPVLRSWLSWREWSDASRDAHRAAREADLMAEMLELMDVDDGSSPRSGAYGESTASRRHGSTFQDRWQPQR